jgi:hypothetical protein
MLTCFCLRAGVRKNALMVLTHLILNDMMKVKGHIARMAMCLQVHLLILVHRDPHTMSSWEASKHHWPPYQPAATLTLRRVIICC